MAKIAAVVVTYNRAALLKTCITALRTQTTPCHIFILDNHSTDETPDVIRSMLDADMTAIHLEKNIGGAGGFCEGVRQAIRAEYDYIWLMDDDTVPAPDALEKLMAADQLLKGQYGFLSSNVLWTDNTPCRMNVPKYARNSASVSSHLRPIVQASFVSCFLPANTIKEVGLPIRDFFIWGDDVEYTRRITIRHRIPAYLCTTSVVHHHTHHNWGSNIALDIPERLPYYQYAYRNENYLYRKEGIKGFCYYTLRCLLHLGRILIKARDHRWHRCHIILSQYGKGLFFNPQIERE